MLPYFTGKALDKTKSWRVPNAFRVQNWRLRLQRISQYGKSLILKDFQGNKLTVIP